jgi:hypothetical protein
MRGGSVGRCEKKGLYEHVSNSEWVPRQSCLNLQDLTPLDFCFVELDEEQSLQKQGEYTRRTVRWHFGCCCPH